MEYPGCRKIDPASHGFEEISSAYELDEPSVAIGTPTCQWFEEKLAKAGVRFIPSTTVLRIEPASVCTMNHPSVAVTVQQQDTAAYTFLTHVAINCTGFQHFVPEAISNPSCLVYFQYTYQICLALRYRDNTPTSNKPISFICMDGWFPCLMPAISNTKNTANPHRDYILTHGAYTILGSFSSIDRARQLLNEELTDELVARNARYPAESEMRRFWPEFPDRFTYEGWYGTVLAKPKCPTEFRSGFTFEHQGVIHVFPGKVSNVFDVSDEVTVLLNTKDNISDLIIQEDNFRLVANGVFDNGRAELQKKSTLQDRSTSSLQTLAQLM